MQQQLELAKAEGDQERELYGQHKCYCDANEASKTKEIERLTKEVSILEAKIEELTANLRDADLVFKIAENCFCAYLFGEITIRFLAFKEKSSSADGRHVELKLGVAVCCRHGRAV